MIRIRLALFSQLSLWSFLVPSTHHPSVIHPSVITAHTLGTGVTLILMADVMRAGIGKKSVTGTWWRCQTGFKKWNNTVRRDQSSLSNPSLDVFHLELLSGYQHIPLYKTAGLKNWAKPTLHGPNSEIKLLHHHLWWTGWMSFRGSHLLKAQSVLVWNETFVDQRLRSLASCPGSHLIEPFFWLEHICCSCLR